MALSQRKKLTQNRSRAVTSSANGESNCRLYISGHTTWPLPASFPTLTPLQKLIGREMQPFFLKKKKKQRLQIRILPFTAAENFQLGRVHDSGFQGPPQIRDPFFFFALVEAAGSHEQRCSQANEIKQLLQRYRLPPTVDTASASKWEKDLKPGQSSLTRPFRLAKAVSSSRFQSSKRQTF